MPEIINARLDKSNFEHLVRQMHDKAIDPKPVLAAIGNLAVNSIRQNFINGGRPNAFSPGSKRAPIRFNLVFQIIKNRTQV
ncbi:hypothetical protein [Fibrobacter sp. UWEL]|uniref:hypothetical protein n=1 Tax=Fibrobacter sp. UWEL TaxID=1896209 RepID=UPI00091E7E46|nr:hypothetical protein [Fibrobacter sp. UWEL]SHL38910.1 hypothetical protein SAMN05720468_12534 [Fibrobacter sp. UWEL]